jgi:cytochrome c biogenesis protein CcmG/thiol:disulfide interchange protein DsbE
VKKYLWPLGIFLVMLVFLAVGLRLDPREVPSPLIDKPAPSFDLPVLQQPGKRFSPAEMRGKVWLLNVWASWCVSCREEHPHLVALSKQKLIPLLGLDYKDEPQAALAWLRQFGDPYDFSLEDRDGRIGIDYGVYGVPETYLIDREGVIRYKRIGVLTPEILQEKVLPLARKLQQ